MRHAEALAPLFLVVVEIDTDDHVRAHEPQTLDDIEPNAAEAEHNGLGAGLHLCRVDHRADARRHAAADVADLFERCVWPDFRDRDFRQYGEIRKGRRAHIMMQLLAAHRETRRPIRHHALPLRASDRGAQIGLA
jgi:hypothetical protein